MRHNHVTRDIKDYGECPFCDEYHHVTLIAEIHDVQKTGREIAPWALDKILKVLEHPLRLELELEL